ncbi:MAG: hypothetical protein IPL47_16560 [Phyllobacteriaceae bacterium]|nr:hypothetical protein [Phyllobacteriaceae bacterium]
MATVTVNNGDIYSYDETGAADFQTYASHSATQYAWLTSNGHRITANGTGISVDGSNNPTGGTITSVAIDVGDNGSDDIVITDISVGLAAIAGNGSGYETGVFWAALLGGNDNLTIASTGFLTIGADFADVSTSNPGGNGGNDAIFAFGNDNIFIFADYNDVHNRTVTGGGDTVTGAAEAIYLDAAILAFGGTLTGGHDSFTQTLDWTFNSNFTVYGDLASLGGGSTLHGGDDVITALAASTRPMAAYGDVSDVAGFADGGIDSITGTNGVDNIFGDFRFLGSASYTGGNDILDGRGGGDGIYGDSQTNAGTLIAGDDTIDGGGGGDTIYGDVEGNTGTLTCGDDTIHGGEGNDTIYGDVLSSSGTVVGGDDTIHGDGGADQLHGGAGADYLYIDGLDTVVDGGADYDWAVGLASTTGITLNLGASLIEAVFGSNTAGDTLNAATSSAGVTIWGMGGADNLTGSAFGDTIYFDDADLATGSVNAGAGFDWLLNRGATAVTFDMAVRGAEGYYGSVLADTVTAAGSAAGVSIYGNGGGDVITGSGFGDYIYFEADTVSINGGAGYDYAIYNPVSALNIVGVTLNLTTSAIEYAIGRSGADTFTAAGATWLMEIHAGGGDDTLTAGNAGSYLFGEAGTDTLISGTGTDYMLGGSEFDTFRFDDSHGVDYIYDWQDGTDRIDLSLVTGIDDFTDLTINSAYAASNWYGVGYGSGTVWVQTGGVGSIETSDFIY